MTAVRVLGGKRPMIDFCQSVAEIVQSEALAACFGGICPMTAAEAVVAPNDSEEIIQ